MKTLTINEMENVSGGQRWLDCTLAGMATFAYFASIVTLNPVGILFGPTLAGTAIARCVS